MATAYYSTRRLMPAIVIRAGYDIVTMFSSVQFF
jgi:hypothetical protein